MEITQENGRHLTTDIITSLTNLPNTITKLHICGEGSHAPLSIIAKFTHLQELILSFCNKDSEGFKTLRHATFQNNGKNLKNFMFVIMAIY